MAWAGQMVGKRGWKAGLLRAVMALGIGFSGAAATAPELAQGRAIGAAVKVQNSVSGTIGGQTRDIADGNPVFTDDLVKTQDNSLARLTFLDETNLSLGPSSQVKLDRFVFDADKSASSVALSMSTGAFRFVTGNSNPRNFKLLTPSASIGIRGTILDIKNAGGNTTVVLVKGAAQVCTRTAQPKCTDLTVPGFFVTVSAIGVISAQLPGGASAFQFANLCSGGSTAICATAKPAPPVQAASVAPTNLTVAGLAAAGAGALVAAQALQQDKTPLKPQSVSFAAITSQPLANGSVGLLATASSGLAVVFTSNTPAVCGISGTSATLLSPGLCLITAIQPGDATVAPAAPVTQAFAVTSSINGITFPVPADTPQANGPAGLAAFASSGLPVSYVSTTPSICTVSGNSVSLLALGACSVTASQGGNAFYPAAADVAVSFNVLINPNTITFPLPPDTPIGQGPVTLGAFADSGLPVSYSTSSIYECSVSGNVVTLIGIGPCAVTASQAGNATTSPAVPVTQTFQVLFDSNAINFPPPPDTLVNAGPVTLNASASSGLPVAYVSNSAAVCSVSGNSVTLAGAGVCSITASQAGNSTTSPAAPVTQTFNVLPVPLAPVATGFSVSVPFGSPGQPVNLGAHITGVYTSVAIAAAPAHGSASLSGAIATYIPAHGYSGPDSFTFTATGPGGTSAPATVSINVAARPDPAQDPDVAGLVRAEVGAMQRFGQTQIDNVNRRLEDLHDDDIAPLSNGVGMSSADQIPSGLSSLAAIGPPRPAAAAQGINAAAPQSGTLGARLLDPKFHVWTGGTLSFGKQSATGLADNRFSTSGVSAGLDTSLADGLKAGVAFGFGSDRTSVGTAGTRSDGSFYSATAYASWRVMPQTFLDATLGYGAASFDTRRFIPADSSVVNGKRHGSEIYGSLALTSEQAWGALKFAPYARLDVMRLTLGQSTETGSDIWALTYRRLNQTSVSGVLGLRAHYPVLMSWGTLTPTARLEYRHAFDGSYRQTLNYADQPAGPFYGLSDRASARDLLSASLGLGAMTLTGLAASFEYQVSLSPQRVESQAVRARLSTGF